MVTGGRAPAAKAAASSELVFEVWLYGRAAAPGRAVVLHGDRHRTRHHLCVSADEILDARSLTLAQQARLISTLETAAKDLLLGLRATAVNAVGSFISQLNGLVISCLLNLANREFRLSKMRRLRADY